MSSSFEAIDDQPACAAATEQCACARGGKRPPLFFAATRFCVTIASSSVAIQIFWRFVGFALWLLVDCSRALRDGERQVASLAGQKAQRGALLSSRRMAPNSHAHIRPMSAIFVGRQPQRDARQREAASRRSRQSWNDKPRLHAPHPRLRLGGERDDKTGRGGGGLEACQISSVQPTIAGRQSVERICRLYAAAKTAFSCASRSAATKQRFASTTIDDSSLAEPRSGCFQNAARCADQLRSVRRRAQHRARQNFCRERRSNSRLFAQRKAIFELRKQYGRANLIDVSGVFAVGADERAI